MIDYPEGYPKVLIEAEKEKMLATKARIDKALSPILGGYPISQTQVICDITSTMEEGPYRYNGLAEQNGEFAAFCIVIALDITESQIIEMAEDLKQQLGIHWELQGQKP